MYDLMRDNLRNGKKNIQPCANWRRMKIVLCSSLSECSVIWNCAQFKIKIEMTNERNNTLHERTKWICKREVFNEYVFVIHARAHYFFSHVSFLLVCLRPVSISQSKYSIVDNWNFTAVNYFDTTTIFKTKISRRGALVVDHLACKNVVQISRIDSAMECFALHTRARTHMSRRHHQVRSVQTWPNMSTLLCRRVVSSDREHTHTLAG